MLTLRLKNIATFLDPKFKTDFVEGVDLETVHDNIIHQGMEIFSSHGMSNATAGSETSLNGTQGGQESPMKKKNYCCSCRKKPGQQMVLQRHVIVHLFNNYKLKLKPTKYHLNLGLIVMKHL